MAEVALKERGIDEALALLKSLPPEVVSKSGGPVKTALRAGARVLQRDLRCWRPGRSRSWRGERRVGCSFRATHGWSSAG